MEEVKNNKKQKSYSWIGWFLLVCITIIVIISVLADAPSSDKAIHNKAVQLVQESLISRYNKNQDKYSSTVSNIKATDVKILEKDNYNRYLVSVKVEYALTYTHTVKESADYRVIVLYKDGEFYINTIFCTIRTSYLGYDLNTFKENNGWNKPPVFD